MNLFLRAVIATIVSIIVAMISVGILQANDMSTGALPPFLFMIAWPLAFFLLPQPDDQSSQKQSEPIPVRSNNPAPVQSNNIDKPDWADIKEYDKRVSAALELIEPLGEPWVTRFADRVLDSDPKDRNTEAIAQQILDEHENSLRLSENESINKAYAEVKEAYGDFGATEFKRLYNLVGDSLDIEKAVISIKGKHVNKEATYFLGKKINPSSDC